MSNRRRHTGNRFVVVGSGPCGSSAARALAERGADVTILEQGPAATDPPGTHLRNGPPYQADPDGYFAAIEPFLAPPGSGATEALPAARVTHAVGGQGIPGRTTARVPSRISNAGTSVSDGTACTRRPSATCR